MKRYATINRFLMHSTFFKILVFAAFLVTLPFPADAKVFLSMDEALKLAFPGCTVERKTVYLTAEQLKKAQDLADTEILSRLLNPYVSTCHGQLGATAYFDTHKVRTLPETLMIVVEPSGKVRRLEVISFSEPEDYLPRTNWYGQFVGKSLTDALNLKKEIRGIAGATLSSRATTNAVRRVLALHQVANGPSGAP